MQVGRAVGVLALTVLVASLPGCGPERSGRSSGSRDPAPAHLSASEQDRYLAGKRTFEAKWGIEASADHPFGGIGPVYNRPSCGSCHPRTERGGPPLSPDHPMLSMVVFLGRPDTAAPGADDRYGHELSPRSIPGVPREGWASIRFEEKGGAYADGTPYSLRKPVLAFRDLAFGGLADQTASSARVAPALAGLGQLERVSESAILARADPEDRNGDGISGRANRVVDVTTGDPAIGRFGWKASEPNLRQQNAVALIGDMGITTELYPDQNCPPVQTDCAARAGADPVPEADRQQLDDLTFFTAALPPPSQPNIAATTRGRRLFDEAGCAACHVPALPLADGTGVAAYTDLLLHDMGPGLADGLPQGAASGREWRTAPLWGLGRVSRAEGGPYLLHDGRARGIAEAILWHGGEAQWARESFRGLSADDRQALIGFLNSL